MTDDVPAGARTWLAPFAASFARYAGDVEVRELAFHTQIAVRSRSLERLSKSVTMFAGVDPTPGTYEPLPAGELVAWTRPDERIIAARPGRRGHVEARLDSSLGDDVTAVDLSCHRSALEIRGPGTARLLAHGTPVDFGDLRARRCISTSIARANVTLLCGGDGAVEPRVTLFVRSSYAAHLARWLLDALESE